MNKKQAMFFGTVISLATIGLSSSLVLSMLLWWQDGHPAGFIIWCAIMVLGYFALKTPVKLLRGLLQ